MEVGQKKAFLVFEDGAVLEGKSFGADGCSGGEVVFNTAMTGYQEILTDPSYAGQIVLMTYPLMGSYGTNPRDVESRKVFCSGFIVKEYIRDYSNWQATDCLSDYLKKENIVAIEGVDTRLITRKIRSGGAIRAVIGVEPLKVEEDLRSKISEIPEMEGLNLVRRVSCEEPYQWNTNSVGKNEEAGRFHVLVVDCGVKQNILRRLKDEGAKVTVIPPTLSCEEMLKFEPDGILISNGPGDPGAVEELPGEMRKLIGKIPIMGICLGHQLIAKAIGAKTYKLKFGHHGANHPVQNLVSQKIEITSQNHGFAVDADSLKALDGKEFGPVKISHLHLSDGTVEGFEMPDVNVRAIQYHPEANPGPHDASYLFEEFIQCIEKSSTR